MDKKLFHKWIGGLFLVVVGVLLLLFLVIGDNSWSTSEHRKLTSLSDVSLKDVFKGTTQQTLESYVSDQFVFRDSFLTARSDLAVAFGEREHNGVFYGKDDYLLENFPGMDEEILSQQTEAVSAFAGKYPELAQYMIVCPTSSEILKLKLPSGAVTGDEEEYVSELKSGFGDLLTYIDVSKTLRNHRDEYIYYRTDHHWTTLGAYYAYKASVSAMELDSSLDNFEAIPVTNTYQGDLRAKSGYGSQTYDTINVYFYQDSTFLQVVDYADTGEKTASMYSSSALSTQDKLDVFFNGEHPEITINTSSSSEKKLLVLGDSSALSFVPFLVTHYREIVVINPSLFTEDLGKVISKEGITDVLYLYHASNLASDMSLTKLLDATTSRNGTSKNETSKNETSESGGTKK